MKRTTKALVIFAMLLATIMFLAGCENKSSSKEEAAKNPIVGAWKYEQGGYTYHFNEDGTGDYSYSSSKMEFTYKTDGNKLSITYKGSTAPFESDFSIDGDTLNIKDSFGKDTLYKKQ